MTTDLGKYNLRADVPLGCDTPEKIEAHIMSMSDNILEAYAKGQEASRPDVLGADIDAIKDLEGVKPILKKVAEKIF